ncbi:MAG: hypothetical protein WD251_08620, partial [Saccharospirillum sp.]
MAQNPVRCRLSFVTNPALVNAYLPIISKTANQITFPRNIRAFFQALVNTVDVIFSEIEGLNGVKQGPSFSRKSHIQQ